MEGWPGTVVGSAQTAAPRPDAPAPEATPAWPGQVVGQAPQKEGGFISRAVKGAVDMVTGDSQREFDYPDLSSAKAPVELTGGWFTPERESQLQKMMTFDRLGTARTDKGKLDILAKEFPDIAATAKQDKFGNTYVSMGDQPHYLNRPGLSREDLSEAQAGVVATAPLTMATGGAYAGASLPARMTLSAIQGGGGSIAQDLMAQGAGSKEAIDPGMAAAGAVGGGLFEFAQPAVRQLFQRLVARPEVFDAATGRLTDEGRTILGRVGFQPEEISDDMARQFADMARNAANPDDAARLAAGRSLPVPVTPTAGDVSRNPSQQMFESLTEKGAYGETAGAVMRNARSGQQEALRANIPAIQERIGGGQVTERGQAGQSVQQRLVAERAGERQAVDQAYDAARQSDASLAGGQAANELHTTVVQAAGPRYRHSPMAQDMAGQLQELVARNPSVTELYNWRRDLSDLARGANPTEKGALDAMRHQFDRTMADFAQTGMMTGDEAAVQTWANAIRARSEYGMRWQSGDILEKLTETVGEGAGRQLKVAPEAASNLIFRGTSNGFLSQPEAVRAMRTLQQGLPPAEWNAVREEAFLRLAQSAEGAYQGGTRDFSGVNLRKAWENFQTKNPVMARMMFNGEERALIGQFTRVAADVTGKVRGGDNPSGTAPALANIVQRLPFLNRTMQFVVQLPGARGLVNARQSVRAMQAANPTLERPNIPFAGVSGQVLGPSLEEQLP